MSSKSDDKFVVVETEAITFISVSLNGLSTAFIDFLHSNLKIIRKAICQVQKMASFIKISTSEII